MSQYIFILGNHPELSIAEIQSVLPSAVLQKQQDVVARFEIETIADCQALLNRLGGTIKIAQVLSKPISEQTIADWLLENGGDSKTGKINFGLSFYNSKPNNIGLAAKKILKNAGHSARLVTSREPVLSSVVVSKNKCQEFLIVDNKIIAVTCAVQDFEFYGHRDFGRPSRDTLSGTLPPKLAQIIINLSKAPLEATLLDPFCGSGTIIQEAFLMGYQNIIGSDVSEKAVVDTKNNFAWLLENAKLKIENSKLKPENIKIIQVDIAEISKHVSAVDAIVAEGYLGPALRGGELAGQIDKTIHELEALYVTTFKEFSKILAPDGTVVIALPFFVAYDAGLDIKKITAGFTVDGVWRYERDDQRVGRQIVRCRLN